MPEHCRAGLWLEGAFNGDLAQAGMQIREYLSRQKALQQKYPDARLGSVIAFGAALWRDLNGVSASAPELKDFRPLGKGMAPATQRDVLIHIQSQRQDVNFSLGQIAMELLGPLMDVSEETQGFRWVEDRDLSGFVDGTENPKGEKRQQVAIIADGEDAGGSYVFTQRWEHNLTSWHKLPVAKQEAIIGRTKDSNEELPADTRPVTSHLSRVDLKENGAGLKILRQSLPYGTVSGTHGLYFIAYCARLHNIEQQLLSMFGESDGKYDGLLRFSKPVSGSYFYAPSLSQLSAL
nr:MULTISPECIES: Dyp-type peroxidase [unclassified Tatumella]